MQDRIINAINNIFRDKLGYINIDNISIIQEGYNYLQITFKDGTSYKIEVEQVFNK